MASVKQKHDHIKKVPNRKVSSSLGLRNIKDRITTVIVPRKSHLVSQNRARNLNVIKVSEVDEGADSLNFDTPTNKKVVGGSRLSVNNNVISKKGNKCKELRLHSSIDLVKDNFSKSQNGS